ncbi:energy transducer TonB [Rufibacter sp. XAAS-G3-1]|uniref:energy transducer TonB n=1 Tax=Rufibacter sp. XAAS-G3-1 TaxID=2729134 RepID=UPI0015E79F44|nr:energy transducer TonB [Rufibacter sp. XAAS-G3-1]
MKRILLFCFLPLSALAAQSQTDTVYLDKYYRIKPDRKEAEYFRLTTYSGSKEEKRRLDTYYLTGEKFYEEDAVKEAKGKYKKEGPTRYFYRNGQAKEEQLFTGNEVKLTKWHENGQVYYKCLKIDGKEEGEALGYYPSGKLRRREQFSKGELTKGECYAENGEVVPYYPHFTHPEFPGGTSALMKMINNRFRIPLEAARSGASGITVVQFLVSKEGKVHDPEIIKSIHPALDKEVLRVVNSLSYFNPATEEGQALEYAFSFPFNVIQRNEVNHQNQINRNGVRNR